MQTAAFIETLLAVTVVCVCAGLLIRQLIGAERRLRLDATLRRIAGPLWASVRRLWRWPSVRRAARREAEAAIRRARDSAFDREGNVYRPKSFRNPRKLH